MMVMMMMMMMMGMRMRMMMTVMMIVMTTMMLPQAKTEASKERLVVSECHHESDPDTAANKKVAQGVRVGSPKP